MRPENGSWTDEASPGCGYLDPGTPNPFRGRSATSLLPPEGTGLTARVVLDDGATWALVVVSVIASLAAVVASVAAWRASRASRLALDQLVAARRQVAVQRREGQERSPLPRRDGVAAERPAAARVEPVPREPGPPPVPEQVPPTVSAPPRTEAAPRAPAMPRRSDALDDPDHPGTLLPARPRTPEPAEPAPRVPSPPEQLRTEPLERPRPKPPLGPPEEREVHPGVFVTTPGRPQAPPLEPVVTPAGPAPPEPQAPASDPSLERLADPDPFVRMEAIDQLRNHPARVEVLTRLLNDEFPVVRRQAVRSLRRAGGPAATRALLDVAGQDPSAEVRQEAVDALGAMLRDVRSNPA